MAVAEVAARPQQDRQQRRKPFTQWVKNLANLKNKGGDQQEKSGPKKNSTSKHKKSQTYNGTIKNNPYPESGTLKQRGHSPASSVNGQLSFATPAPASQRDTDSYGSSPAISTQDREAPSNSNRSAAPTLATKAETVHSDAGHSKAATTTTHGGALSSIDGAGADSTFSSPTHSQHSLTTTLTTIQSASPGTTLQGASGANTNHNGGSLNPVMFSHQYPVSPGPSTTNAISAIPRHMADSKPNTYGAATANGLLSDNASLLTLASSSKRRRRSMDTDISVRALAPSSVWGGSRESLPLSVLSGNLEPTTPGGLYSASQSRPSIGGIASTERASVYSNQGGLASERNSYYRPGKDLADAKSLRSVTNTDTRSLAGDARSINADAKAEAGSLRNYEGSVRSGAVGHGRNDSIPGSIGSPLASPNPKRGSTGGGLSRRSSEWQELDGKDEDGQQDKVVDGSKEGVEGQESVARRDSRDMDGTAL